MVELRIGGSYWELKGNIILNNLAIALENIDTKEKEGVKKMISNIISIGNIGFDECKINNDFHWKVDLTYIPRFHPNLNFHSKRGSTK